MTFHDVNLPKLAKKPHRNITMAARDGAYIHLQGDDAQVIVVGPLLHSPAEYAEAVSDFYGVEFEIKSAEFMKAGDDASTLLALRRGFVSLIFSKK